MLAIEAILKADIMWGKGRRGAGREKKKRKKTLAPAHRNQAVFCDTHKKRVVSAPPEVTQQNRYPHQAAACAVLCFLTSKESKDASLESMNRRKGFYSQ